MESIFLGILFPAIFNLDTWNGFSESLIASSLFGLREKNYLINNYDRHVARSYLFPSYVQHWKRVIGCLAFDNETKRIFDNVRKRTLQGIQMPCYWCCQFFRQVGISILTIVELVFWQGVNCKQYFWILWTYLVIRWKL